MAAILNRGGVIGHHTGTLPGVAALPAHVGKLVRFKQRKGPFLLLADCQRTARGLIRYYSPHLRRLMRDSWPGPVTLAVAARPGLAAECYRSGMLAVRVDASLQVRQLARACGGLLLSSSLNRKGGPTRKPDLQLRMRWHRYLDAVLNGETGSGKASVLLRVWRNDSTTIRP